jgi:hypothetical protein
MVVTDEFRSVSTVPSGLTATTRNPAEVAALMFFFIAR